MSNTRSTTPPKGRATPPRARQSKPEPPKIKFQGKEYRVADDVGIWPLMQFSAAAESGLNLGDQKGLAALYAMLKDVIHPDDWGQFQDDMLSSKIKDLQALLDLSQDAVEMIQAKVAKSQRARPAANGQIETGPATMSR
jgi:hypothetical protein